MSSKLQRRVLQAGAVTIAGGALFVAIGAASGPGTDLGNVPTANQRAAGYAPATALSGELAQIAVAQGSTALESPHGIVTHYGYENDVPSADNPALPQMLPTSTSNTEAQKTEPDKNTYLVLKGAAGADPEYDYGTRGRNSTRTSSPRTGVALGPVRH